MNFFLEPYAYLPSLIWIITSIFVSYKKIIIPTWLSLVLYAFFGLTNIVFNGLLIGGLSSLVAFILGLVFAYTSITRRGTTIFLTILFASLPFLSWILIIVPAFLVAGLVAAIQIRKATEKGYLTMLTGETLYGLGAGGGIPFVNAPKPDLSRIPLPDPNATQGNMGKANKIKIRLPVYFLLTSIINLIVAVLMYNYYV